MTTSNVDRLFDGLAEWIASMRMQDPLVRVPLCRINYAVSAPKGEALMHTFVVYVVNNIPLARAHGRSIDEAARKCWGELLGIAVDDVRLPRVANDTDPPSPPATPSAPNVRVARRRRSA